MSMIKPTAGRTVLVSASTGAPVVGLSLVKLQLAIDHTDDDELLRHYVAAAINLAKDYLEADLLSTGYSQKHDDFSGGEITLERWPVAAADITSITYLGTDGNSATLATTVYKVTAYERSKTRITLKNGQTWPATYLEADAVTINFTAGWGMTAANVWAGPVQVQQAILVMVADWYCNREMVGMSKAAGALLDMVRLHSYG